MLRTALGIVKDGKIETLEGIILPEGQRVLVTMLPDDDILEQKASQETLKQDYSINDIESLLKQNGQTTDADIARQRETARRMREARDKMPPLRMSIKEMVEEGRV
ncbi:MAG: hypothetical protein J4F29_15830 [Candidatus Latescibacteria bacterium]|nr:hypothetical protein [Candidatus Latescibacterota bacterium]